MAEYHVGRGAFGIYAGTLKKNGIEWLHKTNCTLEVLDAAAHYLLNEGKEVHFEAKGKRYALRVIELKED